MGIYFIRQPPPPVYYAYAFFSIFKNSANHIYL